MEALVAETAVWSIPFLIICLLLLKDPFLIPQEKYLCDLVIHMGLLSSKNITFHLPH